MKQVIGLQHFDYTQSTNAQVVNGFGQFYADFRATIEAGSIADVMTCINDRMIQSPSVYSLGLTQKPGFLT